MFAGARGSQGTVLPCAQQRLTAGGLPPLPLCLHRRFGAVALLASSLPSLKHLRFSPANCDACVRRAGIESYWRLNVWQLRLLLTHCRQLQHLQTGWRPDLLPLPSPGCRQLPPWLLQQRSDAVQANAPFVAKWESVLEHSILEYY